MTTVATRVPACATVEVDLSAIAANTRLFSSRTSGALMAVVKADGFGHGAVDVARTALAHGASWLGVTSLDEAFALREAGLRAPVLSWLNAAGADFHEARRHDVDVAVPSEAHLRAVTGAGIAAGVALRVHLHLDAGMARDGAAPSEWRRLCRLARDAERSGAVRVVGLMGHLGNADDGGRPGATPGAGLASRGGSRQRGRPGSGRPLRHLAATSATLTDHASLHTLSRVGAGLVGIDPSGTTTPLPALTLTAPVVGVRRVAAGTPVGYGGSWRAARATTLALLPLGYADGVPRVTSGIGPRCCCAAGVDRSWAGSRWTRSWSTSATTPADLGEVATLFGPGHAGEPTAAEWAAWAGTIEHEIVTGIGARVRAGGPVDDADAGRGGRWRPELRARGLAGVGRLGRRGARPGGVRRGSGSTIARDGAWPARPVDGWDSPTPCACSRAATWRPASAARAARRGRRAGRAVRAWPASAMSARACGPERWRWTSGPPSSSREPWASQPRPEPC